MMRDIRGCGIHHTGSRRETSFETVERWHREKGWGEIGYHIFIDHKGVIWNGRRRQKIGAQMLRQNQNTIGICVAGNNTKKGQGWNSTQIEALIFEILYWNDIYPLMRFGGHRDFPRQSTVCPGLDIKEFFKAHGVEVPLISWPQGVFDEYKASLRLSSGS